MAKENGLKPLAYRVPGRSMSLMPACCLHWPIGEKDLLREWVQAVRKTPDARTILLGDSIDLARSHYRNHVRSYRDDENSQEALDDYARKEVRELAKVLEPIRDRIMGTIRGNHYWEFSDGTNSEQYLCQLLRIPYMGAAGIVRISFTTVNKGVRTVSIFVHHSGGTVGARTTGGDVAGLERVEAGWDVDIYLAGHTHRRMVWKVPQLTITNRSEPRILSRPKVFGRCGTFLKGYKEDHPNTTQRHAPAYAEVKSLRPTDLGWIQIKVQWREKRDGDAKIHYPDYTVSF